MTLPSSQTSLPCCLPSPHWPTHAPATQNKPLLRTGVAHVAPSAISRQASTSVAVAHALTLAKQTVPPGHIVSPHGTALLVIQAVATQAVSATKVLIQMRAAPFAMPIA